jgi:hypothetical protein
MSSHISQIALVSSAEGIVPGSSNSVGSVVPRSARRLSKRPSQRRKSKRNSKIRHSSSEDDCLALEEGDFDADSDSLDAEDEEKSILLDTLAELMGNEFLSDVHFIVGQHRDGRASGQRIPAHRFMLSARSAVFEKMLYGPMKEGKANIDIEVPDMEPEAFLTMLKFVYTAKADLTPETGMFVYLKDLVLNSIDQCLNPFNKMY